MVGKKYWYIMYYMYYITYQYFFKFKYNNFAWDWPRAPPDKMWTLYHWTMKDIHDSVYFDPTCWEYEGAQAKIVVYYPRNELNILWRLPFT